jgi:hypothetical protein
MRNYKVPYIQWVICLALAFMLAACGSSDNASSFLDLEVCNPESGTFSLNITHPYLLYLVGNQWILEGEDEGVLLRLQITVLDETETVAGVTTRIVEEREWEDGELIEVSRNFFTQSSDGNVCYFGEDVDDYEAGEIVSHEGVWRAGVDGNLPGIFLPANPEVGMRFKQEDAPGIAEDEAEIIEIGESFTVEAGSFNSTLVIEEFNPIDNDESEKRFASGVGLIVDEDLELTEFTLSSQ